MNIIWQIYLLDLGTKAKIIYGFVIKEFIFKNLDFDFSQFMEIFPQQILLYFLICCYMCVCSLTYILDISYIME